MTGLRSSRYVQRLGLHCARQSLFKMCVVSILALASHAEDCVAYSDCRRRMRFAHGPSLFSELDYWTHGNWLLRPTWPY